MRAQLVDGHKRKIGDVRISVTDRCNFRCQYCMPAEGLPWLDRDDLLSYEEITRLVGLMASMGVHDVRLTGGEPLARRELWRLVEMLSVDERLHRWKSALPPVLSSSSTRSITTPGSIPLTMS